MRDEGEREAVLVADFESAVQEVIQQANELAWPRLLEDSSKRSKDPTKGDARWTIKAARPVTEEARQGLSVAVNMPW